MCCRKELHQRDISHPWSKQWVQFPPLDSSYAVLVAKTYTQAVNGFPNALFIQLRLHKNSSKLHSCKSKSMKIKQAVVIEEHDASPAS